MNAYDLFQILLVFVCLLFFTPLFGGFMAQVFEGKKHLLSFLRPVERLTYKICGVDETWETSWKIYALDLLALNLIGLLFLFALQLLQAELPLNPQHLGNLSWHLALNTAVSFVTNTNWQAYSGETMMSYLTQMLGLGVQNFLSAATGLGVLLAVTRGLSRQRTDKIGNFWVDLTRSILYVLLPLSFLLAIILVGQGVVQNFHAYISTTGLEGSPQVIPMGPAASQIAVKQLGTNGGGFFNANSAHPFENPTPLSNFLELLAILLIPAALTYTFGIMVRARRQGLVILYAMLSLLIAGLVLSLWAEYSSAIEPASMMEGKETRFGVTSSIVWSTFTTAASNGSVNAMMSSLSPLAGGIALLNILLGEIVFGGVGCGLYGMLLFVLLTVFIAGLMVGRTPEYLGKKIEAREIQMVILAILLPNALILLGSGISMILPTALSSLSHKGPHGLTEVLYAFASAAGNNGSAFAGLNANTPFFNLSLGFCMLAGRFSVMLPALAIAGSMAAKTASPPSFGTFRTDNLLFVFLLIAVILIVGALTFFPALSLGPIIEHFLVKDGVTF
jgi:K+-transporting ATPase ATPase A chain